MTWLYRNKAFNRSVSDFKFLLWQFFQPQLCYPCYGIYLLDLNAVFLSRAESDKCKYSLLWFLPTTLQEVAWAEKEHLGQSPQEASVAGRGLEPVLVQHLHHRAILILLLNIKVHH